MKADLKIGRTEGQVSSYNLFFENGLRLRTDDLTWLTAAEREALRTKFDDVITALSAVVTIYGACSQCEQVFNVKELKTHELVCVGANEHR